MGDQIKAADVNSWFPLKLQTCYAERIIGQSGLTPKQATYFVRLWGYGYLKQEGMQKAPIKSLCRRVQSFYCARSEAADLFYPDGERGSHRSAGLMLDRLVSKKLLRRETFEGSITRLSLHIPDGFLLLGTSQVNELYADAFNVRSDTPLVADFLEELYGFDNKRPEDMAHQIKKGLRQWARQYCTGLRVIRQASDDSPVGFAAFFPTNAVSEKKFSMAPSASLHLSRLADVDPIEVASPGDKECYAVYIRGWQLHPDMWSYEAAGLLFQDSQNTLKQMQEDFPNLCDIYSITIHPRLEAFALTLGFKALKSDSDSSLRWLYMSLDKFLALDYEDALLNFDFRAW